MYIQICNNKKTMEKLYIQIQYTNNMYLCKGTIHIIKQAQNTTFLDHNKTCFRHDIILQKNYSFAEKNLNPHQTE